LHFRAAGTQCCRIQSSASETRRTREDLTLDLDGPAQATRRELGRCEAREPSGNWAIMQLLATAKHVIHLRLAAGFLRGACIIIYFIRFRATTFSLPAKDYVMIILIINYPRPKLFEAFNNIDITVSLCWLRNQHRIVDAIMWVLFTSYRIIESHFDHRCYR